MGMTPAELRAWRAYRKLTQGALADLLGMSRSRIAEYEAGKARMRNRSADIPRVVELALETLARGERWNERSAAETTPIRRTRSAI